MPMVGNSAFRGNNWRVWFTSFVVFLTMVGVRNQKSMVVSDCCFLLVVYMNFSFKRGLSERTLLKNGWFHCTITEDSYWLPVWDILKKTLTLPITFPPAKKIGPESLRWHPEKFALSFRSKADFFFYPTMIFMRTWLYTTATGVGFCPWIVWVPNYDQVCEWILRSHWGVFFFVGRD